jgi:hypothetical protein
VFEGLVVIRRFVVFRERDFDLGVENGGGCDGPRSWYSRLRICVGNSAEAGSEQTDPR